ncbi:NAD(P)H-binding protein [Nonomuraea sp. NPDC050404]|uniref:SDR family oxidoreductase n=1 Tax=Nonomuraea sp. NPDC050404 TaxID=3155783 RepID=UPI00340FB1E3
MILVTGATGNVGRQVVHQLLAAGHPVRAMTRNPATARLPEPVQVIKGDLGSIDQCLEGVESVFLMWPFHTADAAPAVVQAIARHATRVVLLSSGAVRDQPDSAVGRSHHELERRVEQSGLAWTMLWPSTFAANSLWWADQIRAGNTVRGAFGALPMAMLHEHDIAAVAVRALTSAGHEGARHTLTGPQALTQIEQVRILGEALGRPLRWQELTREEERRRLLADDGFPDSFVDALLDGYAQLLDSPPPVVTRTVEEITASPARTFAQWAADHAADFG